MYHLNAHFTLRTNHGSLTWLRNFKDPEGQLARWLEKLQEYDFHIIHRAGKRHANADALSRRPCSQCVRESHDDILHTIGALSPTRHSLLGFFNTELRKKQLDDPNIGLMLTARENNQQPQSHFVKGKSLETRRLCQMWPQLCVKDQLLFRCFEPDSEGTCHYQLIVPQSLRSTVLEEVHAGVVGGHLGQEKTLARLKERFYWPGHFNDVRDWC